MSVETLRSTTAPQCVDGMDDMLTGVKVGVLRLDDPAAPRRNISVGCRASGMHVLAGLAVTRASNGSAACVVVPHACLLLLASASSLRSRPAIPFIPRLQRYILHPDYFNSQGGPEADSPRLDNDVALVMLDAPVVGVPLQRLADNGTVGGRMGTAAGGMAERLWMPLTQSCTAGVPSVQCQWMAC